MQKTMYEEMHEWANKYPDQQVIYYMGRTFSYRFVDKEIKRVASYLSLELDIKKGDVVMICLPNIPSTVILFYAVNYLGAIANMVHPFTPYLQVSKIVEQTNSKHIFLFEQSLYKEEKLYRNLASKITVCKASSYLPLYMKFVYHLQNRKMHKAISNYHSFDQIKGKYKKEIAIDRNECAVYLHSGGTTGFPKTIMLSNNSFNYLASQSSDIFKSDELLGKGMLAVLPTFHGFGLCMCIHASLINGMCSILVPKFSPKELVKIMDKTKVSCICGVPTLFESLLRTEEYVNHPNLKDLQVVFCGGDSMPISLKERFDEVMVKRGISCRMMEGYGLTETITVCAVNTLEENRIGSVGKMIKGMECKILDEKGNEVPCGELGEICVKGPTLMMGYLNEKEITDAVMKDGYVHTGDIGYMDQDQFIYFKQRKKRIIKVSGVAVYPTEIESIVSKVEGVSYCSAIEIPDPRLSSAVKLYVVTTREDTECLKDEILKACKANLIKWAVPKEIEFKDKLPLTMIGKVDYLTLQQENDKKYQN